MADLKRWFKVWTSILEDPSMTDLALADIGRWVRLGAYTAAVGDNGRLLVLPPARRLCQVLDVADWADAIAAIRRLPNVHVEEGQSVNDISVVTWKNWLKYQVDSTVAQRMKTLRSKRREEEIRVRRDKKREDPPLPPQLSIDALVSKYQPLEVYQHVDVRQGALNCQSWCVTNRKRFSERRLVNWLNGDAMKAAGRANGRGSGSPAKVVNPKNEAALRQFAAREERPK